MAKVLFPYFPLRQTSHIFHIWVGVVCYYTENTDIQNIRCLNVCNKYWIYMFPPVFAIKSADLCQNFGWLNNSCWSGQTMFSMGLRGFMCCRWVSVALFFWWQGLIWIIQIIYCRKVIIWKITFVFRSCGSWVIVNKSICVHCQNEIMKVMILFKYMDIWGD